MVRNNVLNLSNDNDNFDIENEKMLDYDVIHDTGNYVNANMYFKYPFGYDYNFNLGDVFSPYYYHKEYDWEGENSVLTQPRLYLETHADLNENAKIGDENLSFK